MKIGIINPITDKRWDSFVNNHGSATIFHTSAWAKVLQERYRTSPTYWIMEDHENAILAGVPLFKIKSLITGKRLLCLPNSESCFPLINKGVDITDLITRIKEEMINGGVSHIEIRGWEDSTVPGGMGLKRYNYFLNHKLELDSDPDVIKNRFTGKKFKHLRNRINRIERSDMSFHASRDERDLEVFYQLYTRNRRRLHLFPEPYQYFKSIFDNIILPGYGCLYLTKAGDRIIGGDINFSFGNSTLVRFGAVDEKYMHLGTDDFLTWNSIKRACLEGRRYYDFGRTHPENHGLIFHKRRWGCSETMQPYYYYPDKHQMSLLSEKSFVYRGYRMIDKFLPDFAVKTVGYILSKHIG